MFAKDQFRETFAQTMDVLTRQSKLSAPKSRAIVQVGSCLRLLGSAVSLVVAGLPRWTPVSSYVR